VRERAPPEHSSRRRGWAASLIEVQDLTVHYDARRALTNVTLRVGEGELFGILGPNGAGKTTLFSVLSGNRKPTRGSARIAGFDPVTQARRVQAVLGIVPQEFAGYEVLSAAENLQFFGAMHRMSGRRLSERTRELLGVVSLASRAHDLVSTYSGGMKRRLNIVLGIVHEPRVVILDEPTTGLDPIAREELWTIIRGLKRRGVTVLLTTHYMHEAAALCDRVAILDRGEVRLMGAPADLGTDLEEVFRSCVTTDDVVDRSGAPIPPRSDTAHGPVHRIRLKRGPAEAAAPERTEDRPETP
jgi:ABC-2 type transport system ATP-binding protein